MEENKKSKNTKKHYLSISFIALFLVAVMAFIGVRLLDDNQEQVVEPIVEKTVNSNHLTEEEVKELEAELQNLTEEELAKLREAANAGVTDERTLRLLLLLDEELTIQVAADFEILVKMPVNGKKTLLGDSVIQTYRGAKVEGMSILEVQNGAELTIDGLVLDANGVRHIITVSKKATLNVKSGTMQWAGSYAINNEGVTNISGGTITNATAGSFFVKTGSELYITGGISKDCYKNHFFIQKEAVVEISDYVMDGSLDMAIKNAGNLKITGGVIKNTSTPTTTGILNDGDVVLEGVEFENCGSAVWHNKGALVMNKVYIHDMTNVFLSVGDGTAEITNCKFSKTAKNGLQFNGGTVKLENSTVAGTGSNGINITKGSVAMKNITVKDIGVHGVLAQHPAKVTAKDVKLENIKSYGWANCGAVTALEKVDAKKCGGAAILNRDNMSKEEPKVALLTLKDFTATECEHSITVNHGAKIIANNGVCNKMNLTNVNIANGTLELSDTKILGSNHENRASVYIAKDSFATFKNVEITGAVNGVRMYGTLDMQGGSVHDNGGDAIGGAMQIWKETKKFTLNNVGIYNNISSTSVGAIYVNDGVSGTITNCNFYDNSCELKGGALNVGKDAKVVIENTSFRNNKSLAEAGGAIYISDGNVQVKNCDFVANSAKKSGAAVYSGAKNLEMKNCNFDKNQSGDQGGAIFVNTNKGTFVGADCIFTKNEAGNTAFSGGAIHFVGTGNTAKLINSTKDQKGEYDFSNAYFKGNKTVGGGGAILVNANTSLEITGYKFEANDAELGAGGIYNCAGNVVDNGCVYEKHTSPTNTGAVRNFTFNGNGAVFTKNGGSFENNTAKTSGGAVTNDKESIFVMNNGAFKSNHANNGSAIWQKGEMALENVAFDSNSAINRGAIYSENETTLQKCTFTNNEAVCAAAIYNSGILTDEASTYKANGHTATNSGGAIRNEGETYIVESTFVENNTADDGGAIYSTGIMLSLENVTFEENTALRGGAVYANIKNATADNENIGFVGTDCVFKNNKATVTEVSKVGGGGAVYLRNNGSDKHYAELINSKAADANEYYANARFEGNTTALNGGALFVADAKTDLTITGYEFKDNEATQHGGAIGVENGTIHANGTRFNENDASHSGGAVFVQNGTAKADFTDCEFYKNTAVKDGGAIRVYSGATVTLNETTLSENNGKRAGGGIYADSASIVEITNGQLKQNKTESSYGGALYLKAASAIVQGTTFTSNNAVDSGGAIYNGAEGSVTLSDHCTFMMNRAPRGAAIHNEGILDDTASTYDDNDATAASSGGAVRNQCQATFVGSVFKNNDTADDGGAIYSSSAATKFEMSDCTFETNTALRGGALYINVSGCDFKGTDCSFKNNSATKNDWAGGAVVFTGTGKAAMANANFEGNTTTGAGGAIVVNTDVEFTGEECQFLGNTAQTGNAIWQKGKMTLKDCTFGENDTLYLVNDGAKQSQVNLTGKTTGLHVIYSKDTLGIMLSEGFDIASDVTLVPYSNAVGVQVVGNAGLVEDAFKTTVTSIKVPNDQYGTKWTVDENGCLYAELPYVTIGNKAYSNLNDAITEAQDGETIVVWRNCGLTSNITLDKSLTITNKGNVTITDARNEGKSGGNLFTINAGKSLTITGDTETVITIDGADTSEKMGDRLVSISAGGTLNLKNVNMKNAYVDRWGAAITNSGTLNLQGGCTFENNSGSTGAIYNAGTITDIGTTYLNNKARTQAGGAIMNDGIATFENSTFTGNQTTQNGGAVANRLYNSKAEVTFTNCTFTSNKAESSHGGAVWSEGKKHQMTNCIFDSNSAKNGGALYISLSNAEFIGTNCIFTNNSVTSSSAYGAGAAMFTGTGTATLNNTYVNNGVYDYSKAQFTNNKNKVEANIYGGAVVIWSSATLNITGYEFNGNTAAAGGAVHVKGVLNDSYCLYQNNSATKNAGGAIRNEGTCNLNHSEFYKNDATVNDGGAIYSTGGGVISATNCTFGRIVGDVNEGNTSATKGGVVYHNNASGGASSYTNCKFVGNSAVSGGAHLAVKKLTLKDCTFENPSQSEGVLEDWQ